MSRSSAPREGCGWAWLNGRIVRVEGVETLTRGAGFRASRGLFETMRVAGGAVPLLDLHLDRLRAACLEFGLHPPGAGIERALEALLKRTRLRHGVARITLAEGSEMLTLAPLPSGLARERREGVRLAVERLTWRPAHLKHTARLPLLLAEERAGREVVRVGEKGGLMETTRSNLFVVGGDGEIETAPVPAVLPGVARRLVLEDLRRLGAPVRYRAPRLADAGGWREVFVTNAVRGVRPVVDLGGTPLSGPRSDGLLRLLQRNLDRRTGVRSPA